MASVNKVILIGNLGREPEIRSSVSGGKVASLNIATTEFRKDSKTGTIAEHTEWHRISIFGKLTDVAEQYLKKGSLVFIEGKIRTNKWTDKVGLEHHGVEVICENLQFLGRRPQENDHKKLSIQHPPTEYDDEIIPF